MPWVFDLMFSKRPAKFELARELKEAYQIHTCNTTKRLVKVVAFLERILHGLLAVSFTSLL